MSVQLGSNKLIDNRGINRQNWTDKDDKGDIRLQFEENNFFHQVALPSKKQLKYFSNTNNSTTLTLSGSPGVSREAKLSTEFEFGSLVR